MHFPIFFARQLGRAADGKSLHGEPTNYSLPSDLDELTH